MSFPRIRLTLLPVSRAFVILLVLLAAGELWAEESAAESESRLRQSVTFLASDRASEMTGQTINVDGGFVMHW